MTRPPIDPAIQARRAADRVTPYTAGGSIAERRGQQLVIREER